MDPPFDLSGKTALVTGAYRGLGFAIARGLARAGAAVVLNGRKSTEVNEAAAKLRQEGLTAGASVFDVTDRAAVRAAVEAIRAEHGSVDILFNNAGIQRRGPLVDFAQDDWDAVLATNLTAPFIVSQAVLPGMMENKRGKIVHIASLMSELARPSVVPYTAAKGGVRQLTRGMAVELAPHNHALAVELASIPEQIRGYGHVKERHLKAAKAKEAELVAAFRAAKPASAAVERVAA